MFSLISRNAPRAGNTYICSSCILKSLQTFEVPSQTSASQSYSTSIHSGKDDSKGAAVDGGSKGKKKATAKSSGNPLPQPSSNHAAKLATKSTSTPAAETPSKSTSSSPRPKAQQRMIDRRKARLASLKAARPDASFKLLLKLYRAELERESSVGVEASQVEVGKGRGDLPSSEKKATKKSPHKNTELGGLDNGEGGASVKKSVKKKATKKKASTSVPNDVVSKSTESTESAAPATKISKKSRSSANQQKAAGIASNPDVGVQPKPSSTKKATLIATAQASSKDGTPTSEEALSKVTRKVTKKPISAVSRKAKRLERQKKTKAVKVHNSDDARLGDMGDDAGQAVNDIAVRTKTSTKDAERAKIKSQGHKTLDAQSLTKDAKEPFSASGMPEKTSASKSKMVDVREEKRKAVRNAMKDFKRAEENLPRRKKGLNKRGLKITRVMGETSDEEAWKRHWVAATASNVHGGSVEERDMLLKLVTQGTMSRDDMVASIPLIQGLLQKWKERDETRKPKTIKMTLGEAMRGAPMSRSALTRKGFEDGKDVPKRLPALEGEVGVSVRGATPREMETVGAEELELTPVDNGELNVPKLSYGLERVLFNPGVYQLQDPRTKVFNFDPYLQEIMPVSEFDFNALKAYVTSSKDARLMGMAKQQMKKYTGSTSSMTSTLGHFHFLLSQWRPINAGTLSRDFPAEYETFTQLQRGPTAIFLRYTDGVYAIDADKEFDGANILSSLGKSMEKLLTLPTNDFERYRKPNSSQITEEERNEEEAFHFTTMGDFLMRSQLDAHDARLPGTGMFDLKTRAVAAIRMDTSKYEVGSGYEIQSRFGEYESYEREYYDLIRSAFLKYSLQVRMGRMDGIFVAYHNTERIFGFQYISLEEMDYALHGTYDLTLGDSEFKLSVDLLNRVLDRATAKYPGKSLRMFFETRPGKPSHFMYIFVQPVEETDIEKIQTANKSEIDEFEARVLGLAGADKDLKRADSALPSSDVEQETESEEEDIERTPGSEEVEIDHAQMLDDGSANAAAQEDDGDDNDEGDDMEEVEEDFEEEDDNEGAEERDIDEDEDRNNEEEEETEEGNAKEDTKKTQDVEETVEDATEELARSEGPEDRQRSEDSRTLDTSLAQDEIEAQKRDTFAHDADQSEDAVSQDQRDIATTSTPQNDTEPTFKITYQAGGRPAEKQDPEDIGEVFAMVLKLRNKVNGQFVERPENLTSEDQWEVDYQIAEIDTVEAAREMYMASKVRRQKILKREPGSNAWNSSYRDKLLTMARRRRAWREKEEKRDAEGGGKPKIRLDKQQGSKDV